jgi:hypothetical protein
MRRPSPRPTGASLVSRRDVLAFGAAAGVAMLVPGVTALAGVRRNAPDAAMLVVADERYGDSVMFAQSLARHGAARFPLAFDAAGLWFDVLAPRMAGTAASLAGLTLESDLFILKRLASASGASLGYLGRHDWRSAHGCRHVLRGGVELDAIARALAMGAEPWPERLGSVLASAPPRGPLIKEQDVALDQGPGTGAPNFFVSWVITSKEPPEQGGSGKSALAPWCGRPSLGLNGVSR